MNSNIIGKRNKLLYRKLESKKFQLTRLSIKKIKNEVDEHDISLFHKTR